MFTMITCLDALSCDPPLLPPVCRPGIRPMETDQSQVTMAVTTPTQTSQVGEHPTRKAVPRQLDFTTTMYGGGPPGSSENSVRTTPSSLYGTQHLSFYSYIVIYCIGTSGHTSGNSYYYLLCTFVMHIYCRIRAVNCLVLGSLFMYKMVLCTGSMDLHDNGRGPLIQRMVHQRSVSNVTARIQGA